MSCKYRIAWRSSRTQKTGYFSQLFESEEAANQGLGELNQPFGEIKYFVEKVENEAEHEVVELKERRRRIAYPRKPSRRLSNG